MLIISGLVKSVAKSDLNDKMTLRKLMFDFIKRKRQHVAGAF